MVFAPLKFKMEPKMTVSKRNLLFQGAIFRFRAYLWEGIFTQVILTVPQSNYIPISSCLGWGEKFTLPETNIFAPEMFGSTMVLEPKYYAFRRR